MRPAPSSKKIAETKMNYYWRMSWRNMTIPEVAQGCYTQMNSKEKRHLQIIEIKCSGIEVGHDP